MIAEYLEKRSEPFKVVNNSKGSDPFMLYDERVSISYTFSTEISIRRGGV